LAAVEMAAQRLMVLLEPLTQVVAAAVVDTMADRLQLAELAAPASSSSR
jgi:hypothetical protein